ncbi:acetyl esterase [Paraglaciecola aquimarina]|uniref:Acetyl esterase n=1 Tax=Paraglaciecola algarum TaxID=3050085 RepID=A0ABS9DCU3_9ALTE|nr:sialate O-acetylesterase [Paraglaciecola sp. G1-23]MCF2949614.1 acetyl esterase [Paraglaciecola sp. G1-23]
MKKYLYFIVLCNLLGQQAWADIRLPKLLSDGMVLQRDTEVKLWGWSDSNEKIRVKLDGKLVGSVQAGNGKWQIMLKSMPAGGPHKISFSGNNKVELTDVYFGDVWIASGQSNMSIPMYRIEEMFPEEPAQANYPLLRNFTVPTKMTFKQPLEDLSAGEWQETTPQNVMNHSAIGYFFGRELLKSENIPIGIIASNKGGTGAECWMDETSLQKYPALYKEAKGLQDEKYLQSIQAADKQDSDAWMAELNQNDLGLKAIIPWSQPNINSDAWLTYKVPGVWQEQGIDVKYGVVWFQREITLPANIGGEPGYLRLGTIVDADETYINGIKVGQTTYQYPPRRYQVPKGILKAGKNIITVRARVNNNNGQFIPDMPYYLTVADTRIDLTGDWKYQIGSVMSKAPSPSRFVAHNEPLGCYQAMLHPLLNLKIKGVIWYQGESNTGRPQEYETLFPELINLWRDKWQQGDFPFLFVQLADFMPVEEAPMESNWAELRYAQFKTLDRVPNTAMAVIIDSGAWNDIHPMDKKTVGERLALAAQALAYKKDLVYSGPLFTSAQVTGNKVTLSFKHLGSGLQAKGEELTGFAIKDNTGEFIWAKSKIVGDKVIVWHPDIAVPSKLRYGWAHSPANANLFNKEGLPASPFEVDL